MTASSRTAKRISCVLGPRTAATLEPVFTDFLLVHTSKTLHLTGDSDKQGGETRNRGWNTFLLQRSFDTRGTVL